MKLRKLALMTLAGLLLTKPLLAGDSKTGKWTASEVRFYSSPAKGSASKAFVRVAVPKDDPVEYEEDAGMLKVEIEGKQGWVEPPMVQPFETGTASLRAEPLQRGVSIGGERGMHRK